jgi:hypothetical protein
MSKPYWKYLAVEVWTAVFCVLLGAMFVVPFIALEVYMSWPKFTGLGLALLVWVLIQSWRGWRKQA